MFDKLILKKSGNVLDKPNKIFFSPGSIISNQGMISLELDNMFHLYESKGKTLVFDINSKKRVFYGDLKLDKSIDFALSKSHYSLDSLVNRNILKVISLIDAFKFVGIYDIFVETIDYLSEDKLENHKNMGLKDFLRVTGLNAPLKYEFLNILGDKFYVLTDYGSKFLYMENNKLNSYDLRTLHRINVVKNL